MTFSLLKRFRQESDITGRARIVVIFLASFVVGCGGGGSGPSTSTEAEHIGKVAVLIGEFKSSNAGNNPKNLDELKNWAIQNGKAEEKDFISTRDKKPYVIEPMAMMRGGGPSGEMGNMMAAKMPVILHEAEGKKGMKYVVHGTGSMGSEMPDAALENLTKGRPDVK